MAAVPDNFGANRLPVITPVNGLLARNRARRFRRDEQRLQAVEYFY